MSATEYDKKQDERIKKLEDKVFPPNGTECGDNPDPNDSHIAHGGWGGNPKADRWEPRVMRDDPNLWKVVDEDGTNIAHRFGTESDARAYIKYHQCIQQVEPCEPQSCPPGQHWDASQCKCVPDSGGGGQDGDIHLKYKPLGNGVGYSFKSGNKGRYQLKADLPSKWNNILQVGYFKIDETDKMSEEISGKNLGSNHNDEHAKEASCFIQGIGYDGTVNSQYEEPHPQNHSLPYIVVTNKPYGNSIIKKWVGLQNTIQWDSTDGRYYLETWVDIEADKIDTEGKPGNKWVLFWKANTNVFKGNNSGNEDPKSYWRLDDIPDGDDGKNVESKYCKVYEIAPVS